MSHNKEIPYKPLKSSELRIVVLHPGDNPNFIECHLEHTSFEKTAEDNNCDFYEALSYEWGTTQAELSLSINGRSCNIRENLWRALFHLRYKTGPRRLWIDALCINQADIKERNHQIGLMDRIYRDEREVAIWVGDGGKEDYCALRHIDRIHSEGNVPENREKTEGDWWPYNWDNDNWWNRHRQKWKKISNFCSWTYWTRLWIIQEVMLATEATVYCGNVSLPWKTIARVTLAAASICSPADEIYKYGRDTIKRSLLANVLHSKLKNEQIATVEPLSTKEPLVDLVIRHRFCECLQTRDKIFGLLSLACDCCRKAMVVDYRETLDTLCLGLLNHYFIQHDSRKLLEVIGHLRDMFSTSKAYYPMSNRFEMARFKQRFSATYIMKNMSFQVQSTPLSHFDESLAGMGFYKFNPISLLDYAEFRVFKPMAKMSYCLLDTKRLSVGLEICINNANHEIQFKARTTLKHFALVNVRPFPSKYSSVTYYILNSLTNIIRAAYVYINASNLNIKTTVFLTRDGVVGFEPFYLRGGDYICQLEDISEPTKSHHPDDQFIKEMESEIIMKGRVLSLESKGSENTVPISPRRFHFHPNIAALLIAMGEEYDKLFALEPKY